MSIKNFDTKTLWHECLESIKVSVSSAIFTTWFSQTHLVSINKTGERFTVEIGCPSLFIKNTVENRYYGLVQDCLSRSLKSPCDLSFVIKEKPNGRIPEKSASPLFDQTDNRTNEIQARILNARLRPGFTFDNFAVSSSNQMAWAASEAVSKNPGTAYNPLFIWGGVGVGKTHLMNAVGHEILKKDSDKKIYFCTGEEFTNDIVEGIRKKSTQSFRNKYRKLDALFIDDIQFIAGKNSVQEEFFHTFNAIIAAGGQIILTSDKPPSDISKLEERLRSRFEAGLTVDISAPDFELRCAIIQIKSKQRGLNIPMEVVQLIAGNVDSARKIEGFLVKLSSEMALKKINAVSEDIVKPILGKGLENNSPEKKTSPTRVAETVCKYFSLSKRQIMAESRVQKLALPRQILMYLLRTELRIQLAEVGRLIGGRDHTTVMHAVDKITRLVSENVNVREDIEGIKKML